MNSHIILGAGLIAVDHVFLSDSKKSSPNFLGSIGGGSVSNCLAMLSLLGHNCYIFGVWGNDLSRFIAEREFKEYEINYRNVVARGDVTKIVSTRQYSHMIYSNKKHEYLESCAKCGASFGRRYQMSKDDIKRELSALSLKVGVFVVDRANAATVTLAKNVKRKNGFVAYDLNFVSYGKYAESIGALLELSDLVKTDAKTLRQLMKFTHTNDITKWKHEYPNLKYLVVTDSEKGVDCYFNINGKESFLHRDAIVNENVKDTGGAGDVFLAVLIHQLINSNSLMDALDFQEKVDRSQALASLSCSLYGSRALQRFFLNNRMSMQEIMNTSKEILIRNRVDNTLDPNIGLPKFSIRPYILTEKGICPVCRLPDGKKLVVKEIRDRENVSIDQMAKTLSGVPNAMFSSFEASLPFRDALNYLLGKNAIFVGSGGSFSAATFGEYLSIKGKGVMAKAITPYEIEGWPVIPKDVCVWLISHGGFNTDILGAAKHLQDLKTRDVIVLTGSKNSLLADLVTDNGWQLVLISSTERNFVSTIGLLTQVSALSALLASETQLEEIKEYFNFENLNSRLKEYFSEVQSLITPAREFFVSGVEPHIIAFARGWGWPALMDLESKVIEGGICTIEISELKNYTHGRWMNLYYRDKRVLVIYETPEDLELVSFLEQKFKRFSPIKLSTRKHGITGSVDLMIKTLLAANFLGNFAKKNILRPKFPKQGRGLYSWEPKFRKGIWEREKGNTGPLYNEEQSLNP